MTTSFPEVAGGRVCDGQPLRAGMTVAVLSQGSPLAVAGAADRTLATIGLRPHWLGTAPVPGPVRVTMSFFETAAGP